MYDINFFELIIIEIRRNIMGNIFSILQEIFMLKEDNSVKVGLSGFKEAKSPIEKKPKTKAPAPKELKLSDLMRRESY